jgi:hypothetical protein
MLNKKVSPTEYSGEIEPWREVMPEKVIFYKWD